jgi:hypothetical protein
MIYRNLLSNTELDIQTVIAEGGAAFLENIEKKLASKHESLVVHTLYVLSSIASGSQKHKKIVLEDRFFGEAFKLIKSSESSQIRIAVLNLILNLVFKDSSSSNNGDEGESKVRKHITDMSVQHILVKIRETERNPEVKGYLDRALKKLMD